MPLRCGDVYPSDFEILNERESKLRKNIIDGKFQSIKEYLDIQYDLLREDFVFSVREGISSYRSKKPTTNIEVYRNVKIGCNLEVIKHPAIRNLLDDDDCKKFMKGSLLIFTTDNFKTISFLATVEKRKGKGLHRNEIAINIINRNRNLFRKTILYTMAECCSFFLPYFHVLRALQTMPIGRFPMKKYIVQVDTTNGEKLPSYLRGNRSKIATFLKYDKYLGQLNIKQGEAFTAALTQEFVVIQGPPGTGKTYLGLKIAEALLENYLLWYRKSPMLIISHKNQALDQFLEGLLDITDNLVRIGEQTKSDKIKNYTLSKSRPKNECLVSAFARMKLNDAKILQDALVVGMTTTAAARMKYTLEELKCPIVIVEEAAEVLEAHVVAALTSNCQHLILLGDHKQLRPQTANDTIGKDYHLRISLFERMVRNGIQCHTLEVQHRMIPEISQLLVPTFYPFLKDHESVKNRSPMLGLDKNVFFMNHKQPERKSGPSKCNDYEAKFIYRLALHFLLNCYSAEQITILATYKAQVELIKDIFKESKCGVFTDLPIVSTLDAFQGQESDIVLLSLVCSNKIGFMVDENRICVALSRARNGFYMIGNMDLLSSHSKKWSMIKNILTRSESIRDVFSVRCQNHPKTVTVLQNYEDFEKVLAGGCFRICKFKLNCGHECNLKCHITHHNFVKCEFKCDKSNKPN